MNTKLLSSKPSSKAPRALRSGSTSKTTGLSAGPASESPNASLAVRRSRKLLITVLTSSIVVAAAAGWYLWSTRGLESTDSAFIDGHRIAVAVQVPGRVSELLVSDNEFVNAGQVILRIDPAEYRVRLERVEAAEGQAESALARARAQLPVAEAGARKARAQVAVAEAASAKSADDLQRYQKLSKDAVSQIVLDGAETQVAMSKANVEAAGEAADGSDAQIAVAKTVVATAEANLRAARAAVAQARLNLSYCELRAPESGYVTRRTVEKGDFVGVGQPLLNLVTRDVFVTANFKETQLAHMRVGQKATITVDSLPGIVFAGHVQSRMAGTGSAFALLPPQNATGNFVKVVQRVPVKIVFDDQNAVRMPELAIGMSVIATVDVADSHKIVAQHSTSNRK